MTDTASVRWRGLGCRSRLHPLCGDERCDCTCHNADDAKHALRWEDMADEC